MLLRNVWLDGERIDIRVIDGVFQTRAGAETLTPRGDEEVLNGGTVCPPFAEPHVHLDATQLGARTPNRSGTLVEGIRNWSQERETLTAADVRSRALTTIRWYLAHGTTRIRTHVDTASTVAAEALLQLRSDLAAGMPSEGIGCPVELQLVAFPQEGILRAPGRRSDWETIVGLGCDAVGAIPHFERTAEEGHHSVRMAFDLAEELGLMIDLHCDETDDPGSRNLEVVCAETLDRGMSGQVVAGHCTALHSYPNAYAAKVVDLVAESGVQVVANPLDNVVLQGRYDGYPRRRGITRVDELWAAGATVGIGHDSVVDPWYRLGTANLLDAAYMLVHVAQLTRESDMRRVFQTLYLDNHLPFGDPPIVAEGEPAHFLRFEASDAVEVLRLRDAPALFWAGKRVRVDDGEAA